MEVEDTSSNPVTKSIPEAQNNNITQGNNMGTDSLLVMIGTSRMQHGDGFRV